MATEVQNQERGLKNLMKLLALAVRNIQWTLLPVFNMNKFRVSEWGDGYYNGDIKTRKTVQAVELNAEQLGLQRSEQLRQLYESLSAGESSPQPPRPSAALSPEDLTDTEWYYLVCCLEEHCQLVKLFGSAMLILLTTKFTASKSRCFYVFRVPTSLDLQTDYDLHYRTGLSAVLNSLYRFLNFWNSSQESSFISWKENGLKKPWKRRNQATPQKLLKKILFEVHTMHDKGLLESTAKNGVKNDAPRPKADKICGNHVLSKRKRREKLNQRFMILKSLVPSNNKVIKLPFPVVVTQEFFCVFGGLWFDIHVTEYVEHKCLSSVALLNSLAFFMHTDKVSILDDTIKYLQDLERKVEELITCSELMELETRTKRQPRDGVERTSDNYSGNENIAN
ncbi:hypothetical protein Gotur_009335 [Gossypium turneri]